MFQKTFQNFYDIPYFLNLILECYLSQNYFLKVKGMIAYFIMFYSGLILYTQEYFAKLNYILIF